MSRAVRWLDAMHTNVKCIIVGGGRGRRQAATEQAPRKRRLSTRLSGPRLPAIYALERSVRAESARWLERAGQVRVGCSQSLPSFARFLRDGITHREHQALACAEVV